MSRPPANEGGDGRPRTSAFGDPDPMVRAYLREWREFSTLVPNLRVWGCVRGGYQYIMSFNARRDVWSVSAKVFDASTPRPRIDLGFHFKTREEAEQACEQHRQETTS